MFKKNTSKKYVALIPARGGSKGLVGKNTKLLVGKPLVQHTIEAALAVESISDVFVSSDSKEVLEIARSLGAACIDRPKAYASDHASAVDVVNHFLSILHNQNLEDDAIILYLQPTSPLRDSRHLVESIDLLEASDCDRLLSVRKSAETPYKMFLIEEGSLSSIFEEQLSNARRQDLPQAYLPNGAIYMFSIREFRAKGGFPSNGSIPYVMDYESSLDIDTLEDFLTAEAILGVRK